MAAYERLAASHLASTTQDLNALRGMTVVKREQLATAVACADSRVAVEIGFDLDQDVYKSLITAHPEVGRPGRGGATMILPGETEAALRGRNHAEG